MEELSTPLKLAAFVAERLETLGVGYVLGGSLASSIVGEPRSTNDIDIAAQFDAKTIQSFVALLGDDFYVSEAAALEAVAKGTSFNVIHNETVQKIDFFVLKQEPYAEIQLKRRKKVEISDDPKKSIYVSSGEDVILNKLMWFQKTGMTSDRQWKDVISVLRIQKGHLDEDYLKSWASKLGVNDLLMKAFSESIPS